MTELPALPKAPPKERHPNPNTKQVKAELKPLDTPSAVAATPEDIKSLAQSMELFAAPRAMMSALAKVGMAVNADGVVNVSHGIAFMTAGELLRLLAKISVAVEKDPKKTLKAAAPMAQLSQAIQRLAQQMKGTTVRVVEESVERPTGKSPAFPVGQPVKYVQANVQVNVQEGNDSAGQSEGDSAEVEGR